MGRHLAAVHMQLLWNMGCAWMTGCAPLNHLTTCVLELSVPKSSPVYFADCLRSVLQLEGVLAGLGRVVPPLTAHHSAGPTSGDTQRQASAALDASAVPEALGGANPPARAALQDWATIVAGANHAALGAASAAAPAPAGATLLSDRVQNR